MKRMMQMHYELYIDSVFFLNFIMNLYLLLLVDRSTLRIASAGRLIMGAAAGAVCALLPLLTGGPGLLKLAAGAIAGTAGMLYITFSVRGFRMFLKLLERLAVYSFGMGGAMLFLIRLIPGLRGFWAVFRALSAWAAFFSCCLDGSKGNCTKQTVSAEPYCPYRRRKSGQWR